jgi:hypothetical protein
MNKLTTPISRLLTTAALAFLLTACGGGGGSSSSGGGLSLSITDAPVNDADIAEVWVRFTEVIVHPADGSGDIRHAVEDTTDPNNILPYREIELKALVGGKTVLLGDIPLDAGDYSQVRLVIDPDHTRIVETTGAEYLVKCPSCTQSGFKLNRDFTIDDTGWIFFIIDFDLRQSLTLRRPNQPRADFDYIVRPTLRILDTELASAINGIVTDQHSELDPDVCWVYLYEGDAASITPDDICTNTDTSICPLTDRPLLGTPVQLDGSTGDYVYNTGFIDPGIYTVALVCESDDPDVDEDLLYMGETEVQADPGPGGAPQQDLVLVEVPSLTLLKTLDSNADEDGSGTVTAGDTLTYRMSLGNDGNLTLTNATVSDPLVGLSALNCGAALPATLAPAATLDCTATYSVQPADISIVNTATANSDQAGPVDSSETVDVVIP